MGTPAQAGQVSSEQAVIGQADSVSEGFVLPNEVLAESLEVLPQADQALLLPQLELPSLEQEPQADAEQWLLNILQQQQAQLQATEAIPLGLALEATVQPLERQSAQMAVMASNELSLQESKPNKGAVEWMPEVAGSLNQKRQAQSVQTPLSASASLPLSTGQLPDAVVPLTPLTEVASVETVSPVIDATRLSETASAHVERSLKLQAPQAKWGEQMLGALREQVEVQLQQRIQSTTIRLDPPELGSLEIFLSHESGRVNVQISAANTEVARLLQQTSERLRGELMAQNFVEVNVEVGQQQGGQSDRRQARWQLPADASVAANGLELDEQMATELRSSDVLVTV